MRKADRTKTGVIFHIQKFSVNDGPGIRTVVFFKGCPLSCRWCANPESQLPQVQVLWDAKKCLSCRRCVAVCPAGAASENKKGIQIHHPSCTGCGQCVRECPGRALSLEGETKTVAQVLEVVLQDLVFYEESGGGITLSGGEILAQPSFAQELLLASKEEGLSTCCETTGFARPEVFSSVIRHVDHVLFDMKHWDPRRHQEGTGVSNEQILSNMRLALEMGKEILPRIPVIPGYNDREEDAARFSALLCRLGIGRCQLLPFHQFGENKYHLLNKPYAYEDVPSLHREELEGYRAVFLDNEIEAFF